MTALELVVDGKVKGYAEDSSQGGKAIDRFLNLTTWTSASVHTVDRIPQGATRIDR